MSTIHAPFNFVPLSEKVFFPDWADKISHDIPFEDGVSGEISLKITAKTPIFVRNGHTASDADAKNDAYKSFSKTSDDKYFIPSTSIKGAIRNVLEIMSFSKMNNVDNQSFGIRDLNNKQYTNTMRKSQCGWLKLIDGKPMLQDCGNPKTIKIEELDKTILDNFGFDPKLLEMVKDPELFKNDHNKNSKLKYQRLFSKIKKEFDDKQFLDSEEYLLNFGNYTLVLTGQSSARLFDASEKKAIPSFADVITYCKKNNISLPQDEDLRTKELKRLQKVVKITGCWKGKGKEFLFPNVDRKFEEVPEDVFLSFKTIHQNSADFEEFWRVKLNKGHKIPVFFHKFGGKLHSIGLSQLYKYPANKSVYDAIPKELKDNKDNFKLDLSECIFGYTNDESLKGRVMFSIAKTNSAKVLKEEILTLNSPKPSYYPIYVQNGYDWDMAKLISGRKRYLRKTNAFPQHNNENDKINSIITPLAAGTIFTSKVRFHNLKRCELGALISAISFLGDYGKTCCHQIGQGKPYGYGSVAVSISGGKIYNGKEIDLNAVLQNDMMIEFVNSVTDDFRKKYGGDFNYYVSKEIRELMALSSTIDDKSTYMKMSTNSDDNEFLNAKKDGQRLDYFSKIKGIDYKVFDLVSKKDELVAEQEDAKRKIQLEELERQKRNSELSQMKCIELGAECDAKYIGKKKVEILSPIKVENVQITLSKFENEPKEGSIFKVVVKQKSKEGKIIQVSKKI